MTSRPREAAGTTASGRGKRYLTVAALAIGDSFNGCAFYYVSDYKSDPSKVSSNNNWGAGSVGLISLKTPICVLFDNNKEFHSFGFEAEDFYTELTLDGDHEKWHFFKRLKMQFPGKRIDRDVEVEDDRGRKMPAKKVFGEVIRYLKNHLLECLKKRGTGMESKDIHWVLPVPAIWSDSAKEFMRETAYVAGIDADQLTIALEPEAASLYCQMMPANKLHCCSSGAKVDLASPGSKFMVIDLGGERADITVCERHADGGLKELLKPDGGPWGGKRVNEAFDKLFINIVGAPAYKTFIKEHPADYLDLQRELETKKRTITPSTDGKITLKVPISIAEIYEEEMDEKIKVGIEHSSYKGYVVWMGDKLRIQAGLFKYLFNGPADNIVGKIKQLLKDPKVKGTNIFLMVGVFSESAIIQDAVRKALPGGKIIIPEEAAPAVIKGAVMFGHEVLQRSSMPQYQRHEQLLKYEDGASFTESIKDGQDEFVEPENASSENSKRRLPKSFDRTSFTESMKDGQEEYVESECSSCERAKRRVSELNVELVSKSSENAELICKNAKLTKSLKEKEVEISELKEAIVKITIEKIK